MDNGHNIILVNNIAAQHSGALEILLQFIHLVALKKTEWHFLIIVSTSLNLPESSNITYINFPIRGGRLFRYFLDLYGVNLWLRFRKIKPKLIISLQDTAMWTKDNIPQIVYFHQAIPFSRFHWSIKESKSLWFYKYIYPRLLYLTVRKKVTYIVQTRCLAVELKKFFSKKEVDVVVIPPSFMNDFKITQTDSFRGTQKEAIPWAVYPAASYPYKNHKIIYEALSLIKDKKIMIFLTISPDELPVNVRSDTRIVCVGHLSKNELYQLYSFSDALLFPSYVESFGLPLLEGMVFNLKILSTTEAFSIEVLKDYENKSLITHDSALRWAEEISRIEVNKKIFNEQLYNFSKTGWNPFIRLLDRELN